MSTLREVSPYELQTNLFQRISEDWMLVGAQVNGKVNMLTASWGGAGILWHKPVVYTFIRPQRYTKELLDQAPTFSLSFFPESYRGQLKLCGSKSGRDVDKVKECGFDVTLEEDAPLFTQADTTIICKKLYRQPLDQSCLLVDGIAEEHYKNNDYHEMYVGEIIKILMI